MCGFRGGVEGGEEGGCGEEAREEGGEQHCAEDRYGYDEMKERRHVYICTV